VNRDEQKGPDHRGMPRRDKLRQERDVKDAHFGIENVAQHTPDKPVAAGTSVGLKSIERPTRPDKKLHAQPEEIRRAAVLEHVIGQFRSGKQSAQAKGNNRAPDKTPGVYAKRRMKSFLPAFNGGGAQDKRGIKTGARE